MSSRYGLRAFWGNVTAWWHWGKQVALAESTSQQELVASKGYRAAQDCEPTADIGIPSGRFTQISAVQRRLGWGGRSVPNADS